ncbi:hypothetical protein [Klebsiella sp. BIGb0407]|uniref:HofO family protein n=1 Tax=Klebsiella sp. BIGb0407 TaxID=2940603 RepID=UPI00216A71AD|nr:hypothetical protein [Klebsiella sp. BIGb0407]MCS3432859.1 hypothetical protein [Klebsiella sp. BIGb0407]
MPYLEQLLTDTRRRYFVITLSGLMLAGLFCGYLLQADYQQQSHYARLRSLQLEQDIVTLKQRVSVLPVPATEIFTPMVVAPVFSVIETLRKSGGRLISWQPGEQQATLELLLDWEKVPWLFRHISYYQGMNLTSFTIVGTKDPMIVALTLEFSYENK